MILTLSMSLGPGLTLVGLGTWRPQDDWNPAVVRAILVAGNALLLPACAVARGEASPEADPSTNPNRRLD